MRDLVALCAQCGFSGARTYIQSGNVVLSSGLDAAEVKSRLEHALAAHMRSPIDVVVREARELDRIRRANPFPEAAGSAIAVIFSSEAIPRGLLVGLRGPDGEVVVAGKNEVYVHYVNGMGRSKLKLPKLPGVQTVRNINTVEKLVELAKAMT